MKSLNKQEAQRGRNRGVWSLSGWIGLPNTISSHRFDLMMSGSPEMN